MAYVSLYRKYRSQTFDDVIGQDHVVRTLRNAVKAGKIAQGYLFCGSRGTGKTTVARLIAKALNCAEGPTDTPCNVCDACKAIAGGAAVDVVEMDAASNRGIDDIREITDGVKYPPMHLRYKVYIIDEAHQVTREAKDAFLKTLEEPPPHAVFILATTESSKIPITIRSRCQQFDFRRGTINEIAGRLRHVVDGEDMKIDDDALQLIARSANGSYRDSLSLLEQVMAYTEGDITSADVTNVLGMVDEEVLLELGDVLGSGDTAAVFGLADRLMREGRDVRELMRSASNHFRDLLALKVGADQIHRGDERWQEQAALYTQGKLIRIIDILAAAEKDLKWNEQHRLALEMALLKALTVGSQVMDEQPVAVAAPRRAPLHEEPETRSFSEPPVKTDVKKPDVNVGPASEPEYPAPQVAEASTPAPKPEVSAEIAEMASDVDGAGDESGVDIKLGDLQRKWHKILMHVQKVLKHASVAALAREGRPVRLEGNLLTVAFGKKYGFHQAGVQGNVQVIERGIWDITGAKVKVTTIIDDSASDDPAVESDTLQKEPEQHPLLEDVLTEFNGTLVDDDNDPWKEQE